MYIINIKNFSILITFIKRIKTKRLQKCSSTFD